ncbi:MAG: hypothetical protein Q8O53_03670 [Candidatus Moranbacteria bacterium]|nr:hypothetical protein [Candidatus Moranbacteria bacterium]
MEEYMEKDKKIIYADHPEYANIQNKQAQVNEFIPKLESVNKWVIDEYREFYKRVQWISAGAISLSVPLLTSKELKTATIGSYQEFHFTNLLLLALAWTFFIFAFLLSLYRNKFHPEYLHSHTLCGWQKVNMEMEEVRSKIFQEDKTLKDSAEEIRIIEEKQRKKTDTIWNRLTFFSVMSQFFLISGIVSFAVFGIATLFL